MCVHHRTRVRPVLVDLEMHQQLGRCVAAAADFFSRQIHDDAHVRRHESLRHAFGRGQNFVVVDPNADVAVVRRHIPAGVHPPADLDDVRAERVFGSLIHAVRRLVIGRCFHGPTTGCRAPAWPAGLPGFAGQLAPASATLQWRP